MLLPEGAESVLLGSAILARSAASNITVCSLPSLHNYNISVIIVINHMTGVEIYYHFLLGH